MKNKNVKKLEKLYEELYRLNFRISSCQRYDEFGNSSDFIRRIDIINKINTLTDKDKK